jgi:hypothetical protein
MTPNDSEKLERLIQSAVKGLPLRQAPRSLELKVLAEIERRSALPWWNKSFSFWPTSMRIGFVTLSAVAAAATVVAVLPLPSTFAPSAIEAMVESKFAWMNALSTAAGDIGASTVNTFSSIPPLWLYGTLAAIVACYGTLVGLGAAAYRTLRSQS